jgi:hypothetical protein
VAKFPVRAIVAPIRIGLSARLGDDPTMNAIDMASSHRFFCIKMLPMRSDATLWPLIGPAAPTKFDFKNETVPTDGTQAANSNERKLR